MKLSIITQYYKTLNETLELAKILEPQLTKEVEIIIVDDGCREKRLDKYESSNVHVFHLLNNSGGASIPRNLGLDSATGEYIAFIDSDDMVSNDYVERVLRSLGSDIIFISWKSQEHDIKIITKPPEWNCAVWCRVYKREIIGNVRFPEELRIAEDCVFNKQIKYRTSNVIKKQIYFYNIRENSLVRSATND